MSVPSGFFKEAAGQTPRILLKKRLRCSCFPVNFAKFEIASILQKTFGRKCNSGLKYRGSSSEVLCTLTFSKTSRSNHQEVFYKKGVPEKFAKITGRHLQWSII